MADDETTQQPSLNRAEVVAPSMQPTAERERARERALDPAHSFRYPDFRKLWLGNTVSTAGQQIHQTTLGWLVYDRTGSGSILGAMNGARVVPMFFLTLLGGVAADRMDRKVLMLVSQLGLVAICLAIALALLFDKLGIWVLVAVTIVAGTAVAFNQPVRQALVPDVVPKTAIPNAVALSNLGMSVTRVLGPGIAGLLIATMGATGNFFVQAGLFVVAAATVVALHLPPRRAPLKRQSTLRDMRDGFAYVRKDRRIFMLLTMSLFPPVFLWPYWNILMPVFAKDALHVGPTGLGILLSSIGVGGTLGAIVVASLSHVERQGLMQSTALVFKALAILGFAMSPSIYVAVLMLFLGGFAEAFYLSTNQTLIQLLAPDHMRGRVVSLMQVPQLVFPLGAMLGGIFADWVGIRATAIGATSIAVVAAILILVASPTVRGIKLSEVTSSP